MKYPQINALVPEAEHFDESAITGEGVWLSTGHIAAIEASLAASALAAQQSADSLATVNSQLEAANNTIQELNANIEAKNETAGDTTPSIQELTDRIATLEAENKKLGGESSGQGTVLETAKDENAQEGKAPGKNLSLNSPEHPLNQLAARKLSAKK